MEGIFKEVIWGPKSFFEEFRDEVLSMEWPRNRLEAKAVIEDCTQHYNKVRPHSSLNYQTPEAFSKKAGNPL
ncbi:transposase [Herbaspirillum sp. C9C3]|nr:transposase [Herbaspirillum sp. C9C3]